VKNRRIEIEGKTKNYCRAFILPMVGMNYRKLPINFINCYVTNDYHIVLVFDKIEGLDEIFDYWFTFKAKDNMHYRGYEENMDEVIVYFEVPKLCYRDYDLFMEGKYSKLSEEYKRILVNFFGDKPIKHIRPIDVTEHEAIYPTQIKRKQMADYLEVPVKLIDEILSKPDLSKEIFKPLNILLAHNIFEGEQQDNQDKTENKDNIYE
jgi:hypothetical protein